MTPETVISCEDRRKQKMKKVSGYISVRALGCYDFEFFVDDDTSDEEIQRRVDDVMECSHHYEVEEGYEEYTEVKHRKKF